MRITILAIGSRGDIQPFLALSLGLLRAGHQVRLASHPPYRDFLESHGVAFVPIQGNPQAIMQGEQAKAWLESGRNPVRFMRHFLRSGADLIDGMLADSWRACQGTDAIVYSTLGTAGFHIAEKLGRPSFYAPLQPLTPSRAFPSVFSRAGIGGTGTLNLLTHRFLEQLMWQPLRRPFNRWRTEDLGLPPIPILGPFRLTEQRRIPYLYGFSPAVVPKPADWPAWHHVTGYWFLNAGADWHPPDDLARFLEAGPPPVYIGFGSMSSRDPAATTRVVLKALALSGQRGILSSGWGGLDGARLPEGVFGLDSAPHDWLFPRMAAVVHHGGAGTTGEGLRAGVPTIVVPFFGDQHFWGGRVAALGVGPEPIAHKRLTPEKLAAAIQQALNDQDMRKRATRVGAQIKAEDGIGGAIGLMEAHLNAQEDRPPSATLPDVTKTAGH